MGLDINLEVDNYKEVHDKDYSMNYYYEHGLSRAFCNLLLRYSAYENDSELSQIGKIVGEDILPLIEMLEYPSDEYIQFRLDCDANSDEEKEKILKSVENQKKNIKGNLDRVLFMLTNVMNKLKDIDDLAQRLLKINFDELNNNNYFSDFNIDKGDGYIDNNFGQDLRNLKRFLEYAKGKNTKTVWFGFG